MKLLFCKNLVKALKFNKIYIIYEASIDHFRSQYSFFLCKIRILGDKMNKFICKVSIHWRLFLPYHPYQPSENFKSPSQAWGDMGFSLGWYGWWYGKKPCYTILVSVWRKPISSRAVDVYYLKIILWCTTGHAPILMQIKYSLMYNTVDL